MPFYTVMSCDMQGCTKAVGIRGERANFDRWNLGWLVIADLLPEGNGAKELIEDLITLCPDHANALMLSMGHSWADANDIGEYEGSQRVCRVTLFE